MFIIIYYNCYRVFSVKLTLKIKRRMSLCVNNKQKLTRFNQGALR